MAGGSTEWGSVSDRRHWTSILMGAELPATPNVRLVGSRSAPFGTCLVPFAWSQASALLFYFFPFSFSFAAGRSPTGNQQIRLVFSLIHRRWRWLPRALIFQIHVIRIQSKYDYFFLNYRWQHLAEFLHPSKCFYFLKHFANLIFSLTLPQMAALGRIELNLNIKFLQTTKSFFKNHFTFWFDLTENLAILIVSLISPQMAALDAHFLNLERSELFLHWKKV